MTKTRLIIFFLILITIILVISDNNIEKLIAIIDNNLTNLKELGQLSPLYFSFLFFITYIAIAALSLPLATIMTILCGMLFNFYQAILIVSFASTIGATFAFLLSRYLFRDFVMNKFENYYSQINDGFNKNGNYYLFAIRMCPIFPYFAVNIVLGLTTIKTKTFYIVSQIGMLPAISIVVMIGSQLMQLKNMEIDIGFNILILLTMLGLLPLISSYIFRPYLK